MLYTGDKYTYEPLFGCNDFLQESSNGTFTDLRGYFENSVSKGCTLEFNNLGYSKHLICNIDYTTNNNEEEN